jgi:hypothetical protein
MHLWLKYPYAGHGAIVDAWYLELAEDGGILRQVGVGSDGAINYRCGPDDFGVWNDEFFVLEPYRPESESWRRILRDGGGHEVSTEEFQAQWNRGTLPSGEWPAG